MDMNHWAEATQYEFKNVKSLGACIDWHNNSKVNAWDKISQVSTTLWRDF